MIYEPFQKSEVEVKISVELWINGESISYIIADKPHNGFASVFSQSHPRMELERAVVMLMKEFNL